MNQNPSIDTRIDQILNAIEWRNDEGETDPNTSRQMSQVEAKEAIKKLLVEQEEINWHTHLENLAGRGYITFEQKDILWNRNWKPIVVELSNSLKGEQ